jgi:hypothetical protein
VGFILKNVKEFNFSAFKSQSIAYGLTVDAENEEQIEAVVQADANPEDSRSRSPARSDRRD